jgi:uncharacterized protein (UPF0333 family)
MTVRTETRAQTSIEFLLLLAGIILLAILTTIVVRNLITDSNQQIGNGSQSYYDQLDAFNGTG